MTSSRDDERRRVAAGQTSQHIPDPGRDFDPWHDYLQLGRLVNNLALVQSGVEGYRPEAPELVNNPNNCSLGWAGRTSLSLDIEEDNGTPNCYKEEQEFDLNSVENNAFSPATSSRRSSLFSATAGRQPHCVSEEIEELDLNSVESIAFSPATSSSSLFSDPAGRRPHCVPEEEFDLNSVERIAFSPATSSRRSSLFSATAGSRPLSEEEFDLNSVESIAFSPATSSSLFSATAGGRSRCVSEESMSSVSEKAHWAPAGRRRRPHRFSVETPTSPSSASSVSDTVGVVGAGPAGGGARRPPRPVCCRFCKQNGESADIYLSHSLKCEDGRVTCPILRQYTCQTCNATGDNAHTRRYCPLAQVGGTGGGDGKQTRVLPETGGALWVLDWDTRACQFEN